jgi:hypothetical protein
MRGEAALGSTAIADNAALNVVDALLAQFFRRKSIKSM